jgi:DNA-binding response OmpR family regulator
MVVDDKTSSARLVADYLDAEGYRTVTAGNGVTALQVARRERPDLIVLDVMMPEMDGFGFLREYRKDHRTPVIMLTARIEETDRVVGLELGADDYVTKPFSLRELVARIRAVLRRSSSVAESSDVIRHGALLIDKPRRMVTVNGNEIVLTRTEYDLLTLLASSPGRVYLRAELLERLQGDSFEGVERTIDVHVHNVRAKLAPAGDQSQWIETVHGVGYRLRNQR